MRDDHRHIAKFVDWIMSERQFSLIAATAEKLGGGAKVLGGPVLCALERLAHAEKVAHLPQHIHLVCYEVPDDIHVEIAEISSLPEGWSRDQELTRQVGNSWLDSESSCLLKVPSVLVPVAESDERNLLVNHKHEDVGRIRINQIAKFKFDERLL